MQGVSSTAVQHLRFRYLLICNCDAFKVIMNITFRIVINGPLTKNRLMVMRCNYTNPQIKNYLKSHFSLGPVQPYFECIIFLQF